MMLHRNAKLGPAGRFALVQAVERGMSQKAAAAAFCVSPATACRWWHRWCEAGEAERRSLACLHDRSSRPRRMPRLLSARAQRRICAARRRTGWGPRLLTLQVGHPHSTISKVLRRHGLSRPPRPSREPEHRYEWPCPGDLLHMDVSRYARFERPGHAVTGDRSQRSRRWMEPSTRVGYDYAHAIVDDRSRLAYVELLNDERAPTVTGFVERALLFFAERGITAKRLMTDNAWPTPTTVQCASSSTNRASAIYGPALTVLAQTGRSNASIKRWRASGPTAFATAHTTTEPQPCHTG
jgi:transposase